MKEDKDGTKYVVEDKIDDTRCYTVANYTVNAVVITSSYYTIKDADGRERADIVYDEYLKKWYIELRSNRFQIDELKCIASVADVKIKELEG